jgi:hypothetical protein
MGKRKKKLNPFELVTLQIRQLKILLDKYKRNKHTFGNDSCPLCTKFKSNATWSVEDRWIDSCVQCPWRTITGDHCLEAVRWQEFVNKRPKLRMLQIRFWIWKLERKLRAELYASR